MKEATMISRISIWAGDKIRSWYWYCLVFCLGGNLVVTPLHISISYAGIPCWFCVSISLIKLPSNTMAIINIFLYFPCNIKNLGFIRLTLFPASSLLNEQCLYPVYFWKIMNFGFIVTSMQVHSVGEFEILGLFSWTITDATVNTLKNIFLNEVCVCLQGCLSTLCNLTW